MYKMLNRSFYLLSFKNIKNYCTKEKAKANAEKLIRVAVIGVPNAGKSTLINELVEHRVCPVSRKVHTTRNFSRAITVRNQTQVVFFDTPGMITEREVKKHHLESTFLSAYRHSIQHADMIGVTHDVSNSFTRDTLHPSITDALEEYKKVPSFLILNKIDGIRSKRVLLDLVRTLTRGCLNGVPYGTSKFSMKRGKVIAAEAPTVPEDARGWPHFEEVFMVSAKTGDGVFKMLQWIERQAKESNWMFEADQHTDREPEDLIVQTVQARLLDYLPQEIPYQLDCAMEFYELDKGQIFASVLVTCPTARIERLICGVNNGKLKQITECCTSDLIETFQMPISLTISTMPKIRE